VRGAWHHWLYLRQVIKELEEQLSFYENFEARAELRHRLGESSLLEKTLIENSLYELRNNYILKSEDLKQAVHALQYLMVTEKDIFPEKDTLTRLVMRPVASTDAHPAIGVLEGRLAAREADAALEKSMLFPELRVGYFRQNITETDVRLRGLQGLTFEVAIPLWFRPQQAAVQRSKISSLQAREELDLVRRQLNSALRITVSDVEKYQQLVDYYEDRGMQQARVIRNTATLQMEQGEIDFFQYLQSMQRYTQTRLQYLETLRNYNLAIIELEYLSE
jgi:cobalt-zinc-cadmium resistance protein CzcA